MLIFRFIVQYVESELRSGTVTQEPLSQAHPAPYYQKANVMESALGRATKTPTQQGCTTLKSARFGKQAGDSLSAGPCLP
jgi:hypothetical protein